MLRMTLPVLAMLLTTARAPLPAQQVLPPLSEAEVAEARAALTAMKADPRGPYLRLRWFCADGSVHPPAGSPCRERGGGVQYAELNDRATRLAALHIHVGTILQAVSFEELFDAAHANAWLQELVLERYLFGVDDGWVLRQARFYRGARQIEDEEARGHAFLERLLSNPAWTRDHFLLASQLVATVPHAAVAGEAGTERIRNLATEIAQLDPAFMNLRIKIHSFPSRSDLDSVEAYLRRREPPPEVRSRLIELRDALRGQNDARRSVEQLARYQGRLRALLGTELTALQRTWRAGDVRETFDAIAALAPRVRQLATTRSDGRTNLVLMDLGLTLQEQAFVLAQQLVADTAPADRLTRLQRLAPYLSLAHAAGFLSERERTALTGELRRLETERRLTALGYKQGLRYLGRALDWSSSTVRSTFAPVLGRYVQIEPLAVGFADAVLRGSVLLPLSQELQALHTDADRLLGTSHLILGQRVSQGIRGLNPGVAQRTLEIVPPTERDPHLEATKIYVLPETDAELRPVAGVLTLDEGNLLSHVQLLARNLGIPNAGLRSELVERLRPAQGREVFFAVSPLGRVIVEEPARLTPAMRNLVEAGRQSRAARVTLDVSRLRLDRWRPVPLDRLRIEDSGVIAGPKAANLGQLAAFFPGRVAPGVALPFGMFVRHVDRPFGGAGRTVLEELAEAYREADRMRAAGRSEDEVDRYMFGVLGRVRQAILELPWIPEVREAIVQAVQRTFPDVGRGVFIRSDTNVEDLPQFSGAGLNLTVANQRTVDDILAAIRRVWTSPFSERAYLWRRQILDEQGQVYPSVLLLESVHSDRSGVLISSGLENGTPADLTIATAEGVGGAVDGEDAETIVVDPAGRVRLLSQAKAPARRALLLEGTRGGVEWRPARKPDVLLQPGEIGQLQAIVAEWERTYGGDAEGRTWDIEFGVVDGRVWLFQVRPFIRFRSGDLLDRLRVLDEELRAYADHPVNLREVM